MLQYTRPILDDMDILRAFLIDSQQNEKQSNELRSAMRRIIRNVEAIEQEPHVEPSQYHFVAKLLMQLMDAEHGILLNAKSGISEQDRTHIEAHIQEQKNILKTIQNEWPALQAFLDHCHELLGKEANTSANLKQKISSIETYLREHLYQDKQLHHEINQLMATLQSSMGSMLNVLKEVGESSPELQQTLELLNQDFPSNHDQAKALLQKAREGLLQAGDKLSAASHTIQSHMQDQVAQMQQLSHRLQEAESDARIDPLTGLGNRRKLAEFLSSTPADICISFIMVDIDHFKVINDRYGHDAGDDVLVALAAILKESIRSSDMAIRLGGEEFCIILPHTDNHAAAQVAEQLRQAVTLRSFASDEHRIDVTISLGVTQRRDHETSPAAPLKRADKALYQAKQSGRNRVCLAK